MLEAMLTAFEESEILTPIAVEECIGGFRDYWVVICQKLGFKHITTDPDDEEKPAKSGDRVEVNPEESSEEIEASGIEIEDEIDPSEIPGEEQVEVDLSTTSGNGVPIQQEQIKTQHDRIIEVDSTL
jgi:hypothetical protein